MSSIPNYYLKNAQQLNKFNFRKSDIEFRINAIESRNLDSHTPWQVVKEALQSELNAISVLNERSEALNHAATAWQKVEEYQKTHGESLDYELLQRYVEVAQKASQQAESLQKEGPNSDDLMQNINRAQQIQMLAYDLADIKIPKNTKARDSFNADIKEACGGLLNSLKNPQSSLAYSQRYQEFGKLHEKHQEKPKGIRSLFKKAKPIVRRGFTEIDKPTPLNIEDVSSDISAYINSLPQPAKPVEQVIEEEPEKVKKKTEDEIKINISDQIVGKADESTRVHEIQELPDSTKEKTRFEKILLHALDKRISEAITITEKEIKSSEAASTILSQVGDIIVPGGALAGSAIGKVVDSVIDHKKELNRDSAQKLIDYLSLMPENARRDIIEPAMLDITAMLSNSIDKLSSSDKDLAALGQAAADRIVNAIETQDKGLAFGSLSPRDQLVFASRVGSSAKTFQFKSEKLKTESDVENTSAMTLDGIFDRSPVIVDGNVHYRKKSSNGKKDSRTDDKYPALTPPENIAKICDSDLPDAREQQFKTAFVSQMMQDFKVGVSKSEQGITGKLRNIFGLKQKPSIALFLGQGVESTNRDYFLQLKSIADQIFADHKDTIIRLKHSPDRKSDVFQLARHMARNVAKVADKTTSKSNAMVSWLDKEKGLSLSQLTPTDKIRYAIEMGESLRKPKIKSPTIEAMDGVTVKMSSLIKKQGIIDKSEQDLRKDDAKTPSKEDIAISRQQQFEYAMLIGIKNGVDKAMQKIDKSAKSSALSKGIKTQINTFRSEYEPSHLSEITTRLEDIIRGRKEMSQERATKIAEYFGNYSEDSLDSVIKPAIQEIGSMMQGAINKFSEKDITILADEAVERIFYSIKHDEMMHSLPENKQLVMATRTGESKGGIKAFGIKIKNKEITKDDGTEFTAAGAFDRANAIVEGVSYSRESASILSKQARFDGKYPDIAPASDIAALCDMESESARQQQFETAFTSYAIKQLGLVSTENYQPTLEQSNFLKAYMGDEVKTAQDCKTYISGLANKLFEEHRLQITSLKHSPDAKSDVFQYSKHIFDQLQEIANKKDITRLDSKEFGASKASAALEVMSSRKENKKTSFATRTGSKITAHDIISHSTSRIESQADGSIRNIYEQQIEKQLSDQLKGKSYKKLSENLTEDVIRDAATLISNRYQSRLKVIKPEYHNAFIETACQRTLDLLAKDPDQLAKANSNQEKAAIVTKGVEDGKSKKKSTLHVKIETPEGKWTTDKSVYTNVKPTKYGYLPEIDLSVLEAKEQDSSRGAAILGVSAAAAESTEAVSVAGSLLSGAGDAITSALSSPLSESAIQIGSDLANAGVAVAEAGIAGAAVYAAVKTAQGIGGWVSKVKEDKRETLDIKPDSTPKSFVEREQERSQGASQGRGGLMSILLIAIVVFESTPFA